MGSSLARAHSRRDHQKKMSVTRAKGTNKRQVLKARGRENGHSRRGGSRRLINGTRVRNVNAPLSSPWAPSTTSTLSTRAAATAICPHPHTPQTHRAGCGRCRMNGREGWEEPCMARLPRLGPGHDPNFPTPKRMRYTRYLTDAFLSGAPTPRTAICDLPLGWRDDNRDFGGCR